MITKNIVMVETLDSVGTGILYPCLFGPAADNYLNYYLVFTNSHVLGNVGIGWDPYMDAHGYVNLTLYDDFGDLVREDDIREIFIYNNGWDFEKNNDIAAILLGISRNVILTLQTNVFSEALENRSLVYTEGYPGVMLGDTVSPRVQFEGKAKTIFPENEKLGVYQITDDYHWYNNFKDRHLLSGLSGGLVYKNIDGEEMILGMNQSVSDISRGENPFKLVYYLKMPYILQYLREKNCILYQRTGQYSYKIEWIRGNSEINKGETRTLLLLGSSGAGKSTLATDFAFHRNKILATSDGQTTNLTVIYDYKIVEDCPEAMIQFYTKEEFVEKLKKSRDQKDEIPFFDINQFLFLFEQSELEEIKQKYHISGSSFHYEKRRKELSWSDEQCSELYELLINKIVSYGKQNEFEDPALDISDPDSSNESGSERENGIIWKFDFNHMTQQMISSLKLCLQVCEEKSFTGLIKSVVIYDMLSDSYAMELKQIGLSGLRFIDTQGLDHIHQIENYKNTLHHIFEDVKNMGIYLDRTEKINTGIDVDDLSLIYVKKLDSGKPDELHYIFPVVQEKFPEAPIYCLFTGIDLFYKTEEEISHLNWTCGSRKVPKAVSYLLNAQNAEELYNTASGSEQRRNCLYLTLKNNLIPYCGDQTLVKKSFAYYKNNSDYIRKLMVSIKVKESSSLEIIDAESCIKKEGFKSAVDNFLFAIFSKHGIGGHAYSSATRRRLFNSIRGRLGEQDRSERTRDYYRKASWDYIYNVLPYDFRIKDDIFYPDSLSASAACRVLNLDYCLSFHDLYYQFLQQDKYVNPIAIEAGCSRQDIQNALRKLEWIFMSIVYGVMPQNSINDRNEGLLIPAVNNRNALEKIVKASYTVRLSESSPLWDSFSQCFREEMLRYIEFNTDVKIRNIIKINPDFEEELLRMERMFNEKYNPDRDNSMNVDSENENSTKEDPETFLDFNDIMRRYFELKCKKMSSTSEN